MGVLEELRLGRGRVADNADVDVTSQVNTFLRLLVHTAHELQENTLFDNLVTWNEPRWAEVLDSTHRRR
jgi:hypothetical protein